MNINKNRLENAIKRIGVIGTNKDGISRTAFSPSYYEALKQVEILMIERGLSVRIDKVGNIFGRIKGNDKNSSVIMIGSHLDTVRNGGLYDGNLGIQSALECVTTLMEHEYIFHHTIEVVAFQAEEGSDLGGTFGSRVALGFQGTDSDIEATLKNYGLTIEDINESKVQYPIHSFLELHIEQGIRLENAQLPIGIVSGIVGITRYKITVEGAMNHAGTTPMHLRLDALVGASYLIQKIFFEAKKLQKDLVATVGNIDVMPNSVNVIPGKVEMILEVRDMSKDLILDYIATIKNIANKMQNYMVTIVLYQDKSSVFLNDSLIKLLEMTCIREKFSFMRMISGAGHDAMEFAKIVPTGMIFVPSKSGISHSIEEYTPIDECVLGTQLLLESIMEIDALEVIT